MLRRLKVKFVAVIMALVGAVLVSVLGGSFLSAWQTQHDITYESLERDVNDELRVLPHWGSMDDESQDGADGKYQGRRANILILSVDLDANGMILATSESPFLIDSDVLDQIVDRALSADSNSGWDTGLHIAWMRLQHANGTWRVSIADTSAADITLNELAIRFLVITILAMGLLFVIALGLATWMLKPVARAWSQQRQFVADASHELKTPLAVIIANTQILLKDRAIPSDSRRWIQSTADESTHMKNLVEELLELARTDESTMGTQGVMKSEPVDFSSLVDNASLEFDAIAFELGTSIDANIEDGLAVRGDAEWLERLSKILIDNACKYSAKGRPIEVSLAREGKRAVMQVTNYGNAIPAEDLEHVFDRFYRTDKARSRDSEAGGFGLGLAIAKGIATSHGGDITVQSNEETGTTFRVALPLLG